MKSIKWIAVMTMVMLLTGCVPKQPPFDYTEFQRSKPLSIVVLPPVNNSLEVQATDSFLSHVTYPLAEAGYYVFPVAVVAETFKQNGVTEAGEAHQIPHKKLHEIFAADTALYVQIEDYGTRYMVLDSVTTVTASASLVDLRNGALLWEGQATANSSEHKNSSSNIGILLAQAAVRQIAANLTNEGHKIAKITSRRLLGHGIYNGILPGPYHLAQNNS